MKRSLALIMIIAMALAMFSAQATSSQSGLEGISVRINGELVVFDQPPVAESGRVLVPLRAIFEKFGAAVDWHQETQTVTAALDEIIIKLTLGNKTAYKNGQPIILDVPPKAIAGRTLVPVRFISESFGAVVAWKQSTKTVLIEFNKGQTIEADNVQLTRVGAANLIAKNILTEHLYAYEVQFFSNNKEIASLAKPKKVFLPHDLVVNENWQMQSVFKLEEDGSLTDMGGRFIRESFTVEAYIKESGIYIIKEKKDSSITENPNISILSDNALFALKFNMLTLEQIEAKSYRDKTPVNEYVKMVENAVLCYTKKHADLSKYISEGNITFKKANEILAAAYPLINDGDIEKEIIIVGNSADDEMDFEDAIISVKELFLKKYQSPVKYPIVFAGMTQAFYGKEADGLYSYPSFADALKSDDYTLTANGTEVFVEKVYGEFDGGAATNIARLSYNGEVEFKLTASRDIKGIFVSPQAKEYDLKSNKNIATFKTNGPGQYVVQTGNLDRLIIFVDPPETNKPDVRLGNIINVANEGADKTGKKDSTEAINKAIEQAASSGKTVYIPNGTYMTGAINLKSNVSIYFEPAAKIKGASDALASYSGEGSCGRALFRINNAENVKIFGRGAIDVDGCSRRIKNDNFRIYALATFKVKNLDVNDIMLMDSGSWNTHIILSDDIVFDNVKVVNNIQVVNTDGINPNWSKNVLIQNSFFLCGDDPVAVKASASLKKQVDWEKDFSYNIKVKNNVMFCTASSLKVGTETAAKKMYDITFENNDIVNTGRAFALYIKDDAHVYNVSWINNRLERMYDAYTEGNSNPTPFEIDLKPRDENNPSFTANAYDILFKDNTALYGSMGRTVFEGRNESSRIYDVTFDNMVIGGIKLMSLDDLPAARTNEFVGNINFK